MKAYLALLVQYKLNPKRTESIEKMQLSELSEDVQVLPVVVTEVVSALTAVPR